jgi:diadenylate cyclase
VSLDSKVTSELINTIFAYNTPLHDGGIIISQQRVEAAACLFPLTQNPNIPKTMGTRHRAALGLSEETDAVIIIVSEETGSISLAVGGKITIDIDPKDIAQVLERAYVPSIKKGTFSGFIKRMAIRRRAKK